MLKVIITEDDVIASRIGVMRPGNVGKPAYRSVVATALGRTVDYRHVRLDGEYIHAGVQLFKLNQRGVELCNRQGSVPSPFSMIGEEFAVEEVYG